LTNGAYVVSEALKNKQAIELVENEKHLRPIPILFYDIKYLNWYKRF